MQIIEPKARVIEGELEKLSVYERIDRCSAVCYQRPPRPTVDMAVGFCQHLLHSKHGAALEMAMIHLVMPFDMIPLSPYITFSQLNYDDQPFELYVVSGSIRAFLEAEISYDEVVEFLGIEFPVFFSTTEEISTRNPVRFATEDEIPITHRYLAVEVICDRNISHQLVRHRPCSFLQESQRMCKYDDQVTFIRPVWFFDEDGRATLQGHAWYSAMEAAEENYQRMRRLGCHPQEARTVLTSSVKTQLIIYASLTEWDLIFRLRCGSAADPEMRRIMVPLLDEVNQFVAGRYPQYFGASDQGEQR